MKTTTLAPIATAVALAAVAWAGPTSAAQFEHLNGGAKGTLKLEFELTGKEAGKALHRTMSMSIPLELVGSTDAGPRDSAGKADDAAAAAALQKRLAPLQARQDALFKPCLDNPEGGACSQNAEKIRANDEEMKAVLAGFTEHDKDRWEMWKATQDATGHCGTIDARVLDPGRPQQVFHSPGKDLAVDFRMCLSTLYVDRLTGQADASPGSFEIQEPAVNTHPAHIFEASDVSAGNPLGHLKFDPSGGSSSGNFTVKGERGVTKVHWSFEPSGAGQ